MSERSVGDVVARLIALTLLMIVGFMVSVGTMIYGWGLTPQSWWWIVGAGVFAQFMIAAIKALCDMK